MVGTVIGTRPPFPVCVLCVGGGVVGGGAAGVAVCLCGWWVWEYACPRLVACGGHPLVIRRWGALAHLAGGLVPSACGVHVGHLAGRLLLGCVCL